MILMECHRTINRIPKGERMVTFMTDCNCNKLGLTSTEAKELQLKYGKNLLSAKKKETIFHKLLHVLSEPMFLLLLIAAIIYFLLGEPRDGTIMLVFVIGVISIDVMQEWKTDKTLNALKNLSAPHITVLRDGQETTIASEDLVPGDSMVICEGVKIPADGVIIKCNDLCIDESSLTGESVGVWKRPYREGVEEEYWRRDYCYSGTLVTQGSALILVDKIGPSTEYGKIGASVVTAPEVTTPLKKQTRCLVKLCAIIAVVLFVLVGFFTYRNIGDHKVVDRVIESILSGVTLAMAMIPEEFPVILTVFLSMGAWRLAKKQALVRKLPSVETLGAVSVLCVDKTGTITMNQMTVQTVWEMSDTKHTFAEIMGLACETDAYDPMEKAMLSYCKGLGLTEEKLFDGEFLTEYAFCNERKMMGHVWNRKNQILVAAKGCPESILSICEMEETKREEVEDHIKEMSSNGLRVIAVAYQELESREEIPNNICACKLTLLGIVGLADPPRESVKGDINRCNKAGIRVVMITGDNGITASAIAKRIGMPQYENIITGDMLNTMTEEELREKVKEVSIFSRVIPEHKMRIVRAFKDTGQIVAMTGDGVNDAPALKYADIGIAMGKRGCEVSREAADLVLMDDNFTTIVETVHDGRRIYDNIRKAVGYVVTIHIPIALSSLLPPILGLSGSSYMLLPLHVVLLELVIDPTCSIVLERQPAEADIMKRNPRNPNEPLIHSKLLIKSIIQGVTVFLASFFTYYCMLDGKIGNADVARTMGLSIIIVANLLLVQVNSSNSEYMYQSMKHLMKDKVMWLVMLVTIFGLGLIIYSPLNVFLKLSPLTGKQMALSIGIAGVSVLWYEVVKVINHCKEKK